ncbi:MAG: hypothetical protein A2172_03865 [Candidatus Woykebacteria bacterium RBG_13_40_15]|uniref:SH3b domain-containing protein n=1 Tax=Candidatus Woykebacteria bacterium RBG_13_40_15 TaxID=1802593 RepID=A0A1G1WAC2_9BACT|nr:MAG: hypothetical protein A2172_03865 [Candidatus Woykebacteria bacterium RBG_13_40_15]
MRGLEKFLFVYSIIAITALFITFGIFSPKPLNLVSLLLIAPSIFYFWIRLTSPESTGAVKWSLRFIITIVILSGLAIFGYYLRQIPAPKLADIAVSETSQPSSSPTETPISTKSATPRGASIVGFLTETPSPVPLQQFKGKTGVKLINVYKTATASAQKITTLDGTQIYLYLLKQGSWYKVALSGSESGWVSASQIQEVQ